MKVVRSAVAQRIVLLLVAAALGCWAQFPDTLWIPVTYYDYHADGSNPNFEPAGYRETYSGLRTGMVRDGLSADRKPQFRANLVFNDRLNEWFRPSGISGTPAAFSIDPFDGRGRWSYLTNYRGRADEWVGMNFSASDPMACVVIYDSLLFNLADIRKGMYRYDNRYFLPLDGRGLGAEPVYYAPYDWRNTQGNNFSFTMELHRDFMYRPGLEFEFTGDDDVWAFIDGRLVMDLGGIHGPLNQRVNLDTLALQGGRIYHFDFFFAERHVTNSRLTLSANFLLSPYTTIALVPVVSPSWDNTPTLRWHPGELSVTYTIQLSATPEFSTVTYGATTRDTFTTTASLSPGTYYWRVRADNAPWSATGMFVVLDSRVPIVVPCYPDPTTETRPTLRWLTPPSLSLSYEVLISDKPDFSRILLDTTTHDTALQPTSALPYGTIYWCVRSTSYPVWSLPDTFTIVPDTVPRLVAYSGDTVFDPSPVLAWHPVPGAYTYRVELATNALFFRATVVQTTDTTWKPPLLRSEIVWYWRVSSDRNFGLFSTTDSFVVAAHTTPVVMTRRNNRSRQVVGHDIAQEQPVVFNLTGRRLGYVGFSETAELVSNQTAVHAVVRRRGILATVALRPPSIP